MITRVAIKNYKCFKDFEYRPGQFQLLAGRNGSGKTTFFEVLELLRRLIVEGEHVGELLDPRTVQRHPDTGPDQTFEVDIEDQGQLWTYRLVVQQGGLGTMIREESLSLGPTRLLDSRDGMTSYLIGGSSREETVAALYRSSIVRLAEAARIPAYSAEYAPFAKFVKLWETLLVVRLNPWAVTSTSKSTARHPGQDMGAFASWFRHVSEGREESATDFFESVGEIIPGFEKLFTEGPLSDGTHLVVAAFKDEQGEGSSFLLEELSQGQIAAIILQAILSFAVGPGAMICLDEPDNFLALREILPFLLQLQDESLDADCQVFLSSHHPEIYNMVMENQIVLFTRSEADHVMVAPQLRPSDLEGLPLSEIMARGWEEE